MPWAGKSICIVIAQQPALLETTGDFPSNYRIAPEWTSARGGKTQRCVLGKQSESNTDTTGTDTCSTKLPQTTRLAVQDVLIVALDLNLIIMVILPDS